MVSGITSKAAAGSNTLKTYYCYVEVTSYPGLPPRLYLAAVERKSRPWRPGYEVNVEA